MSKKYDEDKEAERLLKQANEYFGGKEKIYIFKCKSCKKLDPVPGFIIDEQMGFLKFMKKKQVMEMECPYCGKTMIPR